MLYIVLTVFSHNHFTLCFPFVLQSLFSLPLDKKEIDVICFLPVNIDFAAIFMKTELLQREKIFKIYLFFYIDFGLQCKIK